MKISFLGQGFEPESKNSVGNILLELFKDNKFHSFYGISAFASKSGLNCLSASILKAKNSYKKLRIIVGIDQEGTSKEALEFINSLNIESYIFYQKESPIFHPKIYLFEGDNHTALIVGSSNLTGAGLFCNIESSLFLEFENTDQEGLKLLAEMKAYFNTLFDLSDPNLFKVSQETIIDFIDKGIVPTQIDWNKKYKKNTSERVPKQNTKIVIPNRKVPRIPNAFKGIYKSNPVVSELIEELGIPTKNEIIANDNYTLLWESGPLTERDLNIPRGMNTNPTGSMLFKKGRMNDIDQRHYFRENVFSSLEWNLDTIKGKTHLERTTGNFKFIIMGIDYGAFSLKITHDSRIDSAAYRQNNSVTQISWGEAKTLIAQRDFIGKSLLLFKDDISNQFIIEIK